MTQNKNDDRTPRNVGFGKRHFTENVISQLLAWRKAGIPSALLTLTSVEGSAPRKVGSQMAVNIHKEFVGYISSGCAESAIVEEAVETIRAKERRCQRYGAGSKYVDIVLPCGSGIDIYFDPLIRTDQLERLDQAIRARRLVSLSFDMSMKELPRLLYDTDVSDNSGDKAFFNRAYWPTPRLVIAGRGVGIDYLARFARELEWQVVVASPEQATLERIQPYAAKVQYLSKPNQFHPEIVDQHTAVVLLFHDHDWEPEILAKCQDRPAFFIGALGSHRTHAARKKMLYEHGCDKQFIDRIRGPIGLDIGAKNPVTIAISIIAEIVEATEFMVQPTLGTMSKPVIQAVE